jgi:hypothetical protein
MPKERLNRYYAKAKWKVRNNMKQGKETEKILKGVRRKGRNSPLKFIRKEKKS